MSDQTNVFNSNENDNNTNNNESQAPLGENTPQSVDSFSDQLKEIKAEDGRQKYSTVEEALKALAHSQTYIPELKNNNSQLEAEVNKLREELAKREGVQDIVDKLTKQQEGDKGENHSETPLGEEAIVNLLNTTLEQRDRISTAKANTDKVVSALTDAYGDNVKDAVAQKARELNTTPEEIGKLAETTPDLVLTLFQVKQNTSTLTSGSVNLGARQPAEPELARPEKSLLAGASAKDQAEYMRKIKEHVYKKFDVKE
jgi:cell division protein FtsB